MVTGSIFRRHLTTDETVWLVEIYHDYRIREEPIRFWNRTKRIYFCIGVLYSLHFNLAKHRVLMSI